MVASKKGVSARQLMRVLGLGSYRTGWFIAHRIHEAMRDTTPEPMGGEGKTVEVDETYIGRIEDVPKGRGASHKRAVLTLVEHGGPARCFHVDGVSTADLKSFIVGSVAPETALMTDELTAYKPIGQGFASHESVNRSKNEYARDHV